MKTDLFESNATRLSRRVARFVFADSKGMTVCAAAWDSAVWSRRWAFYCWFIDAVLREPGHCRGAWLREMQRFGFGLEIHSPMTDFVLLDEDVSDKTAIADSTERDAT